MIALLALGCSGEASNDTGTSTGLQDDGSSVDTATAPAAEPGCPPVVTPAADPSLAELPPVVICTWPISGDGAVDPALTELRVSFSKDMLDGAWAWVSVDDSFPETTGDAHYLADGRTNVLPVALEPDTTYTAWINDPFGTFDAFQDEEGRFSAPYPIAFHTGP
jgi:hypothetical protein